VKMPNKDHYNVWLVEDNQSYRESICLMINDLDAFYCGQQFSNWEDALKMLKNGSCSDIILSDIGLPGIDGITGVTKMRSVNPDVPVIMLTVFDDDDKVFEAICAGANGYLLKTATEEEIARALRQALNGGAPLNAQIAGKILSMFSGLKSKRKTYDLTRREKQILGLVTKGRTKKAIAIELNISYHTVDTHIRHIYKKLQVNCRSEAVAKAIRERLI